VLNTFDFGAKASVLTKSSNPLLSPVFLKIQSNLIILKLITYLFLLDSPPTPGLSFVIARLAVYSSMKNISARKWNGFIFSSNLPRLRFHRIQSPRSNCQTNKWLELWHSQTRLIGHQDYLHTCLIYFLCSASLFKWEHLESVSLRNGHSVSVSILENHFFLISYVFYPRLVMASWDF